MIDLLKFEKIQVDLENVSEERLIPSDVPTVCLLKRSMIFPEIGRIVFTYINSKEILVCNLYDGHCEKRIECDSNIDHICRFGVDKILISTGGMIQYCGVDDPLSDVKTIMDKKLGEYLYSATKIMYFEDSQILTYIGSRQSWSRESHVHPIKITTFDNENFEAKVLSDVIVREVCFRDRIFIPSKRYDCSFYFDSTDCEKLKLYSVLQQKIIKESTSHPERLGFIKRFETQGKEIIVCGGKLGKLYFYDPSLSGDVLLMCFRVIHIGRGVTSISVLFDKYIVCSQGGFHRSGKFVHDLQCIELEMVSGFLMKKNVFKKEIDQWGRHDVGGIQFWKDEKKKQIKLIFMVQRRVMSVLGGIRYENYYHQDLVDRSQFLGDDEDGHTFELRFGHDTLYTYKSFLL